MRQQSLWLLPFACAVQGGLLWSTSFSSAFVGVGLSSIRPSNLAQQKPASMYRRLGPRSTPRVQTPSAASGGEAFLPSLPPDNIIDAVERAGPRVTVADAAAAGGMSLETARKGLVDLAAALGTKADIQVTKSGDLVYVFPENARQALQEVSRLAKLRQTWTAAKPVVFTFVRSAFGLALFISLAVIFTAILALSTSGSSNREDRGHRRMSFGSPDIYISSGNPFDIFWYRPTPCYDAKPEKMGFLEAVFSFVFGDGDPNADHDQKALAAVAALARRRGGVLTGEEMAPLLAPPSSYRATRESINVRESWLLDTVARLNGRPEVTDSGEIVYVFDDLRPTADEGRETRGPSILEEREVPFSLADEGQLAGVGLLGAFNVLGAGILGMQLAGLSAGVILPAWLAGVRAVYPGLLAYAIGFLAAPALRYLRHEKENTAIKDRNALRREWLEVLRSGAVDGKLAEARDIRGKLSAPDSMQVIYSTGQDAASQKSTSDMENFDTRLRR